MSNDCYKPYTCEICGRQAHDLEPGNYLTRMSPLGFKSPVWRCKAHVSASAPRDPVAIIISENNHTEEP